MREVYLLGKDFGLSGSDKISITLLNHAGDVCKKPPIYMPLSSVNGEYKANLLENDVLCNNTYYTLTLPNNTTYPFTIFSTPYTMPLDIKALIATGCVKGLVDMFDKNVNEKFIKKFEKFLIGKNPHFQEDEEKLTCRYVDYVNNGHHTQKTTDDVAFVMDRYISQIGLTHE